MYELDNLTNSVLGSIQVTSIVGGVCLFAFMAGIVFAAFFT